jgi:hypothetical protein
MVLLRFTQLMPIVLAVAPLGGAAGGALAAEPLDVPWRGGLTIGWHATGDDYDVLGERREDLVPGAGPLFALRVAYRLSDAFALELEVGAVVAPLEDDSALLVPLRLGAQWRALAGELSPIVGLGAGFVANVAGPGSGDADALFAATAGVDWRVSERFALRLEAGVLASDAVSGALSFTPIVALGVDVLGFLTRPAVGGNGRQPPVPRTAAHGCPPGVPEERCLDSDEDRLIDAFDRCPTKAATRSDGCPDTDQDGVVEPREACPDVRGRPSEWGCPGPIRPAAPK